MVVVVVVRPTQITGCFEKIQCFGLTHPGFDVVKKTYKGDIAKIQPSFRRLLNTYVRHIFGELVRKRHGCARTRYILVHVLHIDRHSTVLCAVCSW